MFEWDEEKRRLALQKHGLDFFEAAEIFQTAYLLLPGRSDIEIRKNCGRICERKPSLGGVHHAWRGDPDHHGSKGKTQ